MKCFELRFILWAIWIIIDLHKAPWDSWVREQTEDKATLLSNLTIIILSRENTRRKIFKAHDNCKDNNKELIRGKKPCLFLKITKPHRMPGLCAIPWDCLWSSALYSFRTFTLRDHKRIFRGGPGTRAPMSRLEKLSKKERLVEANMWKEEKMAICRNITSAHSLDRQRLRGKKVNGSFSTTCCLGV